MPKIFKGTAGQFPTSLGQSQTSPSGAGGSHSGKQFSSSSGGQGSQPNSLWIYLNWSLPHCNLVAKSFFCLKVSTANPSHTFLSNVEFSGYSKGSLVSIGEFTFWKLCWHARFFPLRFFISKLFILALSAVKSSVVIVLKKLFSDTIILALILFSITRFLALISSSIFMLSTSAVFIIAFLIHASLVLRLFFKWFKNNLFLNHFKNNNKIICF